MKSYSPKKSTDSLVGKYRKNVLGETPTLSAIWSVVVSSYPLVLNKFRAAFSRALRIRSACSSRGDRSPRAIRQPPRPSECPDNTTTMGTAESSDLRNDFLGHPLHVVEVGIEPLQRPRADPAVGNAAL